VHNCYFHCAFRFQAPNDSHMTSTSRSVFQDGSSRWPPCTPRERRGDVERCAITDCSLRKRAPQSATTRHPGRTPPALFFTINHYSSASTQLVRDAEAPPPSTAQRTRNSRPHSARMPMKCSTLLIDGQRRPLAQTTASHYQSHAPDSPALSVTRLVSFRAVSRPLELSLQSSLQLSLTVLVCYRSHGDV
jgi:hypothetical protein